MTTNTDNFVLSQKNKPPLINYLTFISAESVSLLGSEIVDFVLIWWITITTKSAFYLALASFIVFGVQILLSPIAGVFVDRWNRKLVIGLSDFGQAVVMLYLIYRFTIGQARVFDVLLLMFISTMFLSFQFPAVSAIIPLMVEEKNLNRINSVNYFTRVFAKVIGAPLGALLLSIWDVTTLLWIDIITFLFAVSVLIFITIPSQKQTKNDSESIDEKKNFFNDFSDGLSIIKSKGMLGFFLVFPISNFFETPRDVLLPLLINYTYQGNAFTLALIISSFQLTVSLTAIIIGWKNAFVSIDPSKIVILGVSGIFIGNILLVIPQQGILGFYLIFLILGMIVMGICSPIVNITMNNLLYKVIPSESLGRVNGVSSSASLSMIPIATLTTGFLTQYLGNDAIRFIIFGSSILGIAALLVIWLVTDLKNIENRLVYAKNESTFYEPV